MYEDLKNITDQAFKIHSKEPFFFKKGEYNIILKAYKCECYTMTGKRWKAMDVYKNETAGVKIIN